MQVREITGYDEDVVFLMVLDESEFGCRVPLVIGTCTIGRIINIIRESEIDHLSMSWAMARMAQLLSCQKSMATFTPGNVGKAQLEGASRGPQEVDVDELVTARESVCLGPFQTEIIEGQVKPLLGNMATEGMGKASCRRSDHFLWDSTFSMCSRASRMEVAEFHSWLGTYPIATSSLRRVCQWHMLCWHHQCPLLSCHWRWKPL